MKRIPVLIPALLWAVAGARADEHAPRVLSPRNADAYSMKTFAQFHRWKDLEGDAKVYEIYRYLADKRTGLYPLGSPAREGGEDLYDYFAVRDPVKMINVYTIGHCGTLGPAMAGILRDMGVGPSRSIFMPGYNHVAAEVFYGGKWHYLDLDLRGIFRRPDGTLASYAESQKDGGLWKGPNTPLFFPLDRLSGVRKAYEREKPNYRLGVSSGGHTMDYVLRRGETLTRWWKPQGGRWDHHPSYHKKPHPYRVIMREPRGPKCKHPSYSVHTHGNGRFVYAPDLTDASADFADGVHVSSNVRPGPDGLTLAEAGEGVAVFEVRSPYVIVPKVGDLESKEDDREASVVEADAAGASFSVSRDNGLTWKGVSLNEGAADLTREVAGSYGYLLKIALKGEPGAAVVRSLRLTTWVQVHPASLPSLRKGVNRMRYVTGDHHELPTHVMEIRPPGYDREAFLRVMHEAPVDYDPDRKTKRAIGPFVVKVPAPRGSRIAWFSAGGAFRANRGKTRNSMAVAVDKPKDYTIFYTSDIPAYQSHWHYNADVEVRLDAPARTVFLKYVGDPGVNFFRIYAHCLRDAKCASSPVKITHAWNEGGELRKKSVRLDGPGTYEVAAEGDPEDVYVEISVPGGAR